MLFLRGGMDGLSLVYPSKGPDREIYEAERPTLKITPTAAEPELKLNDHFSLHPSAKELYALFQKKTLAVIHAVGLTADSRSHFDAQNLMEQGADSKAHLLNSGWIARYLELSKPKSKMAVVSISQIAPTSIYTYDQSLVIDGIRNYHWPVQPKLEADFERSLRSLYALQAPIRPWISEWGTQTLDTLDELKALAEKKFEGTYPKNELGGRLQTLSRLVIEKPEIELATIDMGGWDTHKFQGSGKEGAFGARVAELSSALSLFYEDVSKHRPLIVTVQTEFGRRLKENFSRGTDHGHGSVMMVLGSSIQGGELHGKWPGLATESLYQRADLAVTTDYRAVMSELLIKEMNFPHLASVFPGYKKVPGTFL